jgi:mycothiol synthase
MTRSDADAVLPALWGAAGTGEPRVEPHPPEPATQGPLWCGRARRQAPAVMQTPLIAGAGDVVIRHWQTDADYAAMADVSNACAEFDRLDAFAGPEDYRWMARYLPGFRPEGQILLAEAGGAPVGFAFARLGGFEDGVGHIVSLGFRALPSWRSHDLDATLLARAEAIGLELVDEVAGADDQPRVPETVVEDTETDSRALLDRNGYRPVRWSHRMTRDLSEPIPDRPLPAGFQIRPATRENGMPILRAYDEAMRDSREYGGMSEEALAQMLDRQQAMVGHWVVAWQGEAVVAGVLGWVDESENVAKDRRRGYVERIFTRRPWRRQGVAGALICQDLRNLRDLGMREGALAFDADNPSGAGSLYAALGFRRHNGFATYRRASC